MARTDSDSWDLTKSVGAMATMSAAQRALTYWRAFHQQMSQLGFDSDFPSSSRREDAPASSSA